MNEWKELTLREADIILIDCVHKTPKPQEKGIPYIGIPQLNEGHIDFNANPRLISEVDFIEWTKKAYPSYNDVVLSRRTNPGVTAHVPKDKKFALGQNLVIIRSIGKTVHKPYLRWLLRGPEWWEQINKFLNVGAVFDSLRCGDIPNFKLKIPPLSEQKAIAHILGSLDDKIELNRQMNQTLEAMAQALFKSWFVDFDPVMDNALATNQEIPDELEAMAEKRRVIAKRTVIAPACRGGNHERDVIASAARQSQSKRLIDTNPELAALFPSSFVLNETLGKWIPEGWEVKSLEDLAYCNKNTWSRKNSPEQIEYIDLGNTQNGQILETVNYAFIDAPSRAKRILNIGATYPAINSSVISELPVIVPNKDLLETFESIAGSFLNKSGISKIEIKTLTKLRDRLLPELISGRVRVKDIK